MTEELIKRLRTEYTLCSIVDGLEDVAAVLKDAADALSRPAPAVQVPVGMALVPVRATDEMLDDIEEALKDMGVDPELAGEIDKMVLWMDALAAAPASPAATGWVPEYWLVTRDDGAEWPERNVTQVLNLHRASHVFTIKPVGCVELPLELRALPPAPSAPAVPVAGVDVEKVMALVERYADERHAELSEVGSLAVEARASGTSIRSELRALLAAPASPAATGPVPVLLPVVPTAPILGVLNEMLTNCHSVEESYADLRRAAAAPPPMGRAEGWESPASTA